VAEALSDKRWIQDITGTLTAQSLSEYLILWQIVEAVELRVGVEDIIRWKWTTDAAYSARSAYLAFFQGTIHFEGAKPIWKTWAPQKVILYVVGSQTAHLDLGQETPSWADERCNVPAVRPRRGDG